MAETYNEKESKKPKDKKIITFLIIATILLAVVGVSGYFVYVANQNIVAQLGDKKVTKTEYEDAKAKCDSFYIYNKDAKSQKRCSDTQIEDLILRKALETEAEKRGITVSQDEINKRYTGMAAAYGGVDNYNASLKATYGWTPEYVKGNFKRDILEEKLAPYLLNSRSVYGWTVRWDWFTGEASEAQSKTNEAVSKKVIDDDIYPLIKNGATKAAVQAEIAKLRAKGAPWDKSYNIVTVPFEHLNAKNGFQRFTGKEDWNAIAKLQKVGDITGVVRSSGGYFAIYKLEAITDGRYYNWDDFKKDAVRKSKINSVSYLFNQAKQVVLNKIHAFTNDLAAWTQIKKAYALTSCQWYHFSDFYGYIADGSNASLRLDGVTITATKNNGKGAECSGEVSSVSTTSSTSYPYTGQGYFKIGKAAENDANGGTSGLNCWDGWYIDISKAGYESMRYNRSVAPNGTEIPIDRQLNTYSTNTTDQWEWYQGPGGTYNPYHAGYAGYSEPNPDTYESWNNNGDGIIFMKPTTPAPTCNLTQTPNPVTKGSSVTIGWTTQYATGGTINWGSPIKSSGLASSDLPNGKLEYIDTYSPTTFKLDVTGVGGTGSCSLTTNLQDGPNPNNGTTPPQNQTSTLTLDLSANPTTINKGGNTALTWSTTNASFCYTSSSPPSSAWDSVSVNKTSGTVNDNPSSDTTYSMTCYDAYLENSVSKSVTVYVVSQPPPPPPSPPSCYISVNPNPITQLFPAVLGWGTDGYYAVINGTKVSSSGSKVIDTRDVGDRTYSMTAYGSGGSSYCSATLTVNPNTSSSVGPSAP